ncbi:MAG: transcription-repair coupling factor, partial [Candidatus Sungbacteria bacterium]|nr:transcription-repair coupling factor [Candidatus Sungbacteria bacterium]
PPPERIPIQTYVLPYSRKTIRSAIEAEISRKGQIYFLHNRIETLGRVKEKMETLLAKNKSYRIRIGIIHGRMDEKGVVSVMQKFRNHELDLLLATTIIENGLDISNANTLIVDDATRLGLAQAHQLRGRIGRGSAQAFAYFLYPPRIMQTVPQNNGAPKRKKQAIPHSRAFERLEVLQEYAKLGSGYEIALRDLEIRGAGNILGREQSGSINKVGLNLYYQMLGNAIEELKSPSENRTG